MTQEKAVPTPISLYPKQRAIVEAFVAETNRSFSNAVQVIIEDWARISGFEEKMQAAQAEKREPAPKKTKRGKSDPGKVRGVRKGMAALSTAALSTAMPEAA